MDIADTLGENSGMVILQIIIVCLAALIILLIYMDRSNINELGTKISNIEFPACPDCPKHPDCICDGTECPECPDCNCPVPTEGGGCPACPKCPDVNTSCPSPKTLTPEDIADAIFPGRNKGITSHGQYFPLDGLGEGLVEPAYSPVVNLMPNYVGGDGVPASISFADQTLLNKKGSIGLAAEKRPPLSNTQGVFTPGTKKEKPTKQATKQDTKQSKSETSSPISSSKGIIQEIEDDVSNIF